MKKYRLFLKLMSVLLPVLYAVLLCVVYIRPSPDTGSAMRIINNAAHIPSFAVFSILFFIFSGALAVRTFVLRLVFSFSCSIIFSSIIELYQSGIPGRESSVMDVFLNIIGIAAGLGIVYAFRNMRLKKNINKGYSGDTAV